MIVVKPKFFSDFKCVGEKCTNTCCKGWMVSIDKESMERYLDTKSTLSEKLERCIDRKKRQFIMEDNQCPFLQESLLCEIYKELGEEALCYTCQTYPRKRIDVNDYIQYNLSFSCPEVARLVISNSNIIEFEMEETLKPDYRVSKVLRKIPIQQFQNFFNIQSISIDILQRKDISLRERLYAIITYSKNIQKEMDRNIWSNVELINSKYSDMNYMNELFTGLEQISVSNLLYSDLMFLLLHSKISLLMCSKSKVTLDIYEKYIEDKSREYYMDLLENNEAEFDLYMKDRCYEYENYYVYMIYELYMLYADSKNILKPNVMINTGFALARALGMLLWIENNKELSVEDNALIMSCYAKTFMHGEETFNEAFRLLSSTKYNQTNYQMGLVRNNL